MLKRKVNVPLKRTTSLYLQQDVINYIVTNLPEGSRSLSDITNGLLKDFAKSIGYDK